MAITGELGWTRTFKIDAREVVEHEAHRRLECILCELFLQAAPVSTEGIEGVVKIIFIKRFVVGQAAGWGQEGTTGAGFEREF